MNNMIQKLPEIEDGRQWWLAFNVADDDDLIRRAFEARFGYPPREIVRTGGSKNVGPIEEHPITLEYGDAAVKNVIYPGGY